MQAVDADAEGELLNLFQIMLQFGIGCMEHQKDCHLSKLKSRSSFLSLRGSKALFLRAEYRLPGYREISIAPPLEKTFRAKQAALEECAKLYVEAIRFGDAQTVSASLHRLGEAFEDFRSAILSSPPPRGLSGRGREGYAFLLEEKAAPIEDRAVEAYLRNLRQAVGVDYRSEWVDKSLQRLKTLRPARFVKKGQYAIPVLTVPAFLGVMERGAP